MDVAELGDCVQSSPTDCLQVFTSWGLGSVHMKLWKHLESNSTWCTLRSSQEITSRLTGIQGQSREDEAERWGSDRSRPPSVSETFPNWCRPPSAAWQSGASCKPLSLAVKHSSTNVSMSALIKKHEHRSLLVHARWKKLYSNTAVPRRSNLTRAQENFENIETKSAEVMFF